MKVCILTQPLHKNYGGLLQAYALQKVLIDDGHEVLTADIPFKKPRMFGLPSIIKASIKRYIFNKDVTRLLPISKKEKSYIQQKTDKFIFKYLKLTERIKSTSQIDRLDKYNFDAFIVGSDQVWRPRYSPGITTYFLDFLKNRDDVIKMSYAASFGIDNCNEFSDIEKAKCGELAKKFHAVSVREDSAVDLCRKEFGIYAEHVLDPTLLLDKETYIDLIEQDSIPEHEGNMMVYVLDRSSDKQAIIDKVAQHKELTPYAVMPDDNGIYPSVTQWLRGFMDAEYVVTDSFHGVAFSIIFNKPFIAIGNKDRGLARFLSLLNIFDLTDRLVFNYSDLTENKINQPINFKNVNDIMTKQHEFSIDFIRKILK